METVDQLVSCAVTGQSASRLLTGPVDWDALSSQCCDDGVAPSLHTLLAGDEGIPASARTVFRDHFERATMVMELYRHVVKELAERAASTGRMVAMQGLALGETLYGAGSARLVTDADLLLPDGNAPAVRGALAAMGFAPLGDYANVWTRNGLCIDLHEDLWGADRIPARRIVAPGTPATFVPSTAIPGCLIPAPPLLAVHAAFHAAKHALSRRLWALDLLLLHGRGAFDGVLDTDARRLVAPVLGCVLERYGMGEAWSPLHRGALTRRQRAAARLMGTGVEGAGEIILALTCRRWRQTAAYILQSLLPPRRILQQMYGRAPGPVLVVRRLGALARLLAKALHQ